MKRIIYLICILTATTLACGTSAPLALLPVPTATAAPAVTMESHIDTSTPKVPTYCFGIVQVDRLNLRERPSFYAPADGQGLVKFQVVAILEFTENWYFVETSDGRKGYARAEYVKSCI